MASGALVVVSGAPGSGKTTLARPLARALGLPLLSKDTIKEALYDHLRTPRTLRGSRRLGRASVEVLYALLDDVPFAVTETHWYPGVSGPRLLAFGRPLLEVHCRCAREVRAQRIAARDRHPGHHDSKWTRLDWTGYEEPLTLGGPLLEVDTSAPVELEAVAAWVRSRLPA